MTTSIDIPTEEQGEVTVNIFEDSIYVSFYHEQMELTESEAVALMCALGVAIHNMKKDN